MNSEEINNTLEIELKTILIEISSNFSRNTDLITTTFVTQAELIKSVNKLSNKIG